MQLEAIIAALTAAEPTAPDFTDTTAFPNDVLDAMRTEAIQAGSALGADALPAKRAHVQVVRSIAAELAQRASAAEGDALNAELAAIDAACDPKKKHDPTMAAAEPVTASDTPETPAEAPADPVEDAPTVEAAAETPVEDAPVEAAVTTDPTPPPAETATAAATTTSTPTEDAMTITDSTDRVAALEDQVATLIAERDEGRRAALTVGDAPGQAAAAEPTGVRRASLTVLYPDREPESTSNVGVLGRQINSVASQSGYGNFNKVVAAVDLFEPGTEMLKPGAGSRNTELLFGGTESRRQTRTAAACDCGPLARRLDLPICFTTSRPLADRITNRWPIETMSYEFYRGTNLSDFDDGVEVWTCTDQAAINPADADTWKQCATLDCSLEPVTETAWAIWSCLLLDEFQNWTILPVAENRIQTLAAQTARISEAQLQARLRALSVQYDAVGILGAAASLFEILDAATVGVEWADRLADVTWTPVIPRGMAKLMATDLRNKAFSCNDTMGSLNGMFNDAGYDNPVVLLDDFVGAGSPQWIPTGGAIGGPAIPLPTFQAQAPVFRVYLVDFDSIHMGQRPVYSMREVRDLDRYRQNQYGIVMETAESLGRHGCIAPIALNIALCPSGTRAELTEYPCTEDDFGTPGSGS